VIGGLLWLSYHNKLLDDHIHFEVSWFLVRMFQRTAAFGLCLSPVVSVQTSCFFPSVPAGGRDGASRCGCSWGHDLAWGWWCLAWVYSYCQEGSSVQTVAWPGVVGAISHLDRTGPDILFSRDLIQHTWDNSFSLCSFCRTAGLWEVRKQDAPRGGLPHGVLDQGGESECSRWLPTAHRGLLELPCVP
jgi:hypothetical protein